MKLVTAILARNEAAPDRYLQRVIKRCQSFSDAVCLLDDRSSDATPKLAKSLGCKVKTRSILHGDAWGREAPARIELWDWAAQEAGEGWVLICDADMLLNGDPRPYLASWDVNAWAFPLVDCWDSETTFRVDGPWAVGPATPRPWLFAPSRVPEGWKSAWQMRGIHCGHFPANFCSCVGVASTLFWKHLAYLSKAERVSKHAQYATVADQLSPFERAHAASILD